MERYDHTQEKASAPIPTTEAPATNGFAQKGVKTEPKVKSETPQSSTSRDMSTPSASKSEPASDSDEDIPPPKRRRKQAGSKEMDDAKLAAMLQAQENNRGRSTRGGGSAKKQKVVKKRTPKKKSEKKVGADDDSEMEVGSDGEVKQKVKKGGFHKQYYLSAPLADLVGEPTVSRPTSPITPRFLRWNHFALIYDLLLTNSQIALSTASRQKDMGIHQSPGLTRPSRQAPDPMRRQNAVGFQAGQGSHVYNEQNPRKPVVSC
jgi:chromatin remodeling complex protein RSC6